MRSIVIREAGGPEVLKPEEVPDPEPGEAHVLVRVERRRLYAFNLGEPLAHAGL